MANLVAPKNMLEPITEKIITFSGLNRKTEFEDGEMSDMLNLTSDNYPVLTPRRPRGNYQLPNGAVKPLKLMERFERIAMIAKKSNGSVAFFYNRTEVANVTGLTEDTEMVAINTKICFFPQKTYLELVRTGSVVTAGEYGNLEADESVANAAITLNAEDARLSMNTIASAEAFAYDDAVVITGTVSYTDQEGTAHSNVSCNVACAITDVVGNSLVLPALTFNELMGEGATNIIFNGSVQRTMPKLDIVIEWNNRLWGVSNLENTVYACKLGDPKNWLYYQGTSLDSYYAQQGTDEDWTGCAAYSGHLVFFKQNNMTKIYGTAPSNYQITNTQCFGVERGSRNSVVIINDAVFYKSTIGIMVYEGGTPASISDKLNTKFRNVIAGTEGQKYYASIEKMDGSTELVVLDVERGMWHKEDSTRFEGCCTYDGRLYYIEGNSVKVINPETASENYGDYAWKAVFGPFDEYYENRKIFSKLSLRFKANESNVSASVYIALDEGSWELVKEFEQVNTDGEFIPIVPRRCDRYSIKIEGTGNCEIKSLTRRARLGTGDKL